MSSKLKRASPVLEVAALAIGQASQSLVSATSDFNHSFELAIDAVRPDPDQPRSAFDDKALRALADTLRAEGQLQPILVRRDPERKGQWIIVAGERRWRAARLLDWTAILAMPFSGDPEVATLLENLQRVDLSPLEEARGLRRLIEGKGWTQDHAAKALGKPKSDISGTLGILSLPDDVLSAVLTSEPMLGKNVLVELARVGDPAGLAKLVALAKRGSLTVKAVREVREATQQAARRCERKQAASLSIIKAIRIIDHLITTETRISTTEADALRKLQKLVDELLERLV